MSMIATRDRILSRARVVLAMGGKPTIADFAAAAGVSRAAFYRAFESREALFQALNRVPEPGARDRILGAAFRIVGERGLSSPPRAGHEGAHRDGGRAAGGSHA
ncbi:MAG: TetR family transcriptional regulator [Chloroflexi bacterium]|nr:MAG: TetR family transcriptional regulator [Chloroflexota bacterium]